MAAIAQTTVEPHVKLKKIAVLTDSSRNAALASSYAAQLAKLYKARMVQARASTRFDQLKEADLLVVGKEASSGSTAETLLSASPVPVLTVGPNCRLPAGAGNPLRTVLYATDYSPQAAHALRYALSMVEKHGAQLCMVHATGDEDVPIRLDRWMLREGPAEALRSIVRSAPNLLFHVTSYISCGTAASVILGTASNVYAGLIVMGRKRSSGTTAYEVSANAPCPVLTVPCS